MFHTLLKSLSNDELLIFFDGHKCSNYRTDDSDCEVCDEYTIRFKKQPKDHDLEIKELLLNGGGMAGQLEAPTKSEGSEF